VLPWGPLGAGFLTGRYERGVEPPEGTRIGDATDDLEEVLHRRGTEANFRAVDEARAVADEIGATVPQIAIAWLLHQPGVTAPIIGPRTLEQLEDLLPAAGLTLTEEQLDRLGRFTAPPPGYPHRMLDEQVGVDFSQVRLQRS
jgi:aryl-alcohol dehydrogenase-like predicted oxidoreductase